MNDFRQAYDLLKQFKGDTYLHGIDVLPQIGSITASLGRKAALVRDAFPGSESFLKTIRNALAGAGVQLLGEVDGAAPNAPRQDLARITQAIKKLDPEVIISFGGGSTIDATKAAEVLRTLGGSVDDYFGTGLVSQALATTGKLLTPHVAIQTAASSAAHLTKYSNITDLTTGQKKLIVDGAIVPPRAVFDYRVSFGAPASLTADGALDGISHALEVLYSAAGKAGYESIEAVAAECIRLVVNYLPAVLVNPGGPQGREGLGLATDLGGYSIMLGGTNGAHLTSFSLVDILSHGRACGMLNPYYTVFFAPAIQAPLKVVGKIYQEANYTQASIDALSGRELGMAVAKAMIAFEDKVGFPTKLEDVPGFKDEHLSRALAAAKDPQLKMKLENMPVRLTAEMVDEYMGPVLLAAKTGNLDVIKNVT